MLTIDPQETVYVATYHANGQRYVAVDSSPIVAAWRVLEQAAKEGT